MRGAPCFGPALVQKCLDFAADHGGKPLTLPSPNALDVALRLYRPMGFVDAYPPGAMKMLAQTEAIMTKTSGSRVIGAGHP